MIEDGDYNNGTLVTGHNQDVDNGSWTMDKYTSPDFSIRFRRSDWWSGWHEYSEQAKQVYRASSLPPGVNGKRLHCVAVYTPGPPGDLDNGTIEVFVNGYSNKNSDNPTPSVQANDATAYGGNGAFIGGQRHLYPTAGHEYADYNPYTGYIDEVILEPRSWTKKYINMNYAQSLGRLAPVMI